MDLVLAVAIGAFITLIAVETGARIEARRNRKAEQA